MGSVQAPIIGSRSSSLLETSCGFLLQELQMIWDEVGEDKFEREKVLLDLEQECVDVYRRKVDRANISRARLHQEVAEAEAEFTHLLLSLGERSLHGIRPEKRAGTLKEQLDSITPALKEMRVRKDERLSKFRAVKAQIHKIYAEIAGQPDEALTPIVVNENDLSLKKLEEYQTELQRLYTEKNERLHQVENYIDIIHSLSTILGKDYSAIIAEVHPSLIDDLCGITKNISDTILAKLNHTVESLVEEKHKRLDKLHHLGKELTKLWNLMDTPKEDQKPFSHVINLLSSSSAEVSDPGSLSIEIIQQAEAEVRRLDQVKASRMKELFQKKQEELMLICNKTHMEIPSHDINNIIGLINSGEIDHSDLLMSMDEQIARAKEEASSRKAIMDKVEKWILARDEECWLEEYSMDENRYSVSRGNHKNLRRAERARLTVKKIPALVDLLMAMTKMWEEERNKVFLYDQVSLMAMLEEYNMQRQEKEEEKKRQIREKKKVQISPRVVEQDNIYAFRPVTSSSRRLEHNKAYSTIGLNGISVGNNNHGMSFIKDVGRKVQRKKISDQPTFASHFRDDASSVVSTYSGPFTS